MKKFLKILAIVCAMPFLSVDCYGVNESANQGDKLNLCHFANKNGINCSEIVFLIDKAEQDLSSADFATLDQYLARVRLSENRYIVFFRKQDTFTAMLFLDCENSPIELSFCYKDPMLSDEQLREMKIVAVKCLTDLGRVS